MNTPRLASLLLLSTALATPTLAQAQAQDSPPASAPPASPESPPVAGAPGSSDVSVPGDTPAEAAASAPEAAPDATPEAAPETTEVSVPGGEIVVTGSRERNIAKASDQVVSVLSTAEIARTGEGNIAGALGRVTGLSVVGNGFVYVRGLGDRYSLALLNGSPLPSPEPLRRVVPLDLFPSGIIASTLVQKSYSANFPGEFGGGVINLTTRSTPSESFLTIGAGVSADTETTGQLGYVHYGSKSDWTGFDNGQRDTPPALAAYFKSGVNINEQSQAFQGAIAKQLVTGRNAVLQRWKNMPPNFSANMTAGTSIDLDGTTLGFIAAAGYSNKWQTRDAINQSSLNGDLSALESDFRRVITDDRIVVNGLLGIGLEFAEGSKIRWTNLYIRDTLKNTRLALGKRGGNEVTEYQQQNTAWFERQLIDTQFVGEFRPADWLSVDVRGGYANSQREAPAELGFEYVRTNVAADPFGAFFINRLNNGANGDATISYSNLHEDLWFAGVDVTWKIVPDLSITGGYAFQDTLRTSSRRDFQFTAPSDFPAAVGLFRPDYLLQGSVIDFYKISLIETNTGNPAFSARLQNHAGYAKINAHVGDFDLDAGVRYETADQTVVPVQVFNTPLASTAGTNLSNDYWLPTATLTWQLDPSMQVRIHASKTIARPQFRELIYQFYFDPDSNRQYQGNPLLRDSQLTNAEARFEWYFAPEQRLSVSAFYKRIKNPIEAFVAGADFVTSFANAPKANLYGAEFELQKYFDLSDWGGMFTSRRIVAIANYTYTQSKLKVGAGDAVQVFAASSTNATDYFTDGAPLTGQSAHLANAQLGLEDRDGLSQQTFLITYASKRVTSRGIANSGQPDIFEDPGIRLDFVARQGFDLLGKEFELKFEARNITGRRRYEFQKAGSNRVDINTYDLGRVFSLSGSVRF